MLTVLYLKNVVYWTEDDRLRSKHVAVMRPDCICNVTSLIYRVTIKEIDTFNVVLKRNY